MKKLLHSLCLLMALGVGSTVLSSFEQPTPTATRFPYQKAGLTEREAAAHLLSRFTFGARPGQVDEVVNTGLEKWFKEQLDASLPDEAVDQQLERFPSLKMTNAQIIETYPQPAKLLRQAIKDGTIDKDSAGKTDRKEYREALRNYLETHGMKPQAEMVRDLINQKIIRATYSNNQLREVLTDFWFNHFNVSLTKNDDKQFIIAYERDAIRPNVLGHFEDLLMATAKSPAMLTYLDNFRSSAPNEKMTARQQQQQERLMQQLQARQSADTMLQRADVVGKLKNARQAQGLNENYAREIMELHTLGVDGGYTQSDVTQAARILTGWTIYPMGDYGAQAIVKMMDRIGEERMRQQGFVHEGDFFFAANRHDQGEKKVLGTTFPAGGGYEEGAKLIHLLATHPSTAKFISRKLAVRFVSDNPPQSLVDKMAATFSKTNGNIREVLLAMVSAPEFWTKEAVREKTKSPFELAISSVRSLDAQVAAPYQLYNWITKMGQQIYSYQAPTGFPDRGQYWINTGSLLNRMNFGLALASQRIPGISFNLAALNQNHEPESAEAALATYSKILLPERNVDETVKRLKPMLSDPELEKKVGDAAGKTATKPVTDDSSAGDMTMSGNEGGRKNDLPTKKGLKNAGQNAVQMTTGNNSMLGQVVGIIIGSPEFQRK